MSLRDKIKLASTPTRDVRICLDGKLVYQRELALRELLQVSADLRAKRGERRHLEEEPSPGVRLGQGDVAAEAADSAITVLESKQADIVAQIADLEGRMVAAEVVFRFTALPKYEFEELRTQAQSDDARTYSLVARASGKYVDDDDDVQDIDSEVWDELEPQLTVGQWAVITEALQAINVVEGKQGLSFLRRGSAPTPS